MWQQLKQLLTRPDEYIKIKDKLPIWPVFALFGITILISMVASVFSNPSALSGNMYGGAIPSLATYFSGALIYLCIGIFIVPLALLYYVGAWALQALLSYLFAKSNVTLPKYRDLFRLIAHAEYPVAIMGLLAVFPSMLLNIMGTAARHTNAAMSIDIVTTCLGCIIGLVALGAWVWSVAILLKGIKSMYKVDNSTAFWIGCGPQIVISVVLTLVIGCVIAMFVVLFASVLTPTIKDSFNNGVVTKSAAPSSFPTRGY